MEDERKGMKDESKVTAKILNNHVDGDIYSDDKEEKVVWRWWE